MPERQEIKTVYIAVDDLNPYDRNARKHGTDDVQAIVESIKEFGFNDPIGVWGDKNTIVEGHGRLLAAKLLGMKYVPCIRLDHLTDEQRRGYALAHNKTAELSKWDDGMLDIELGDITDIDMSLFGFDAKTELPPIPTNLDAEENADEPLIVKIKFDNYEHYALYETQIKQFMENNSLNWSLCKNG